MNPVHGGAVTVLSVPLPYGAELERAGGAELTGGAGAERVGSLPSPAGDVVWGTGASGAEVSGAEGVAVTVTVVSGTVTVTVTGAPQSPPDPPDPPAPPAPEPPAPAADVEGAMTVTVLVEVEVEVMVVIGSLEPPVAGPPVTASGAEVAVVVW